MILNSCHLIELFIAAPSACGGSAGPTTAAPTEAPTAAPSNCITHWIGDNYCDDQNNNAACQFDGGDCCNNSNSGWNNYCSVSKKKMLHCKAGTGFASIWAKIWFHLPCS